MKPDIPGRAINGSPEVGKPVLTARIIKTCLFVKRYQNPDQQVIKKYAGIVDNRHHIRF
jgi:hypothetical protein